MADLKEPAARPARVGPDTGAYSGKDAPERVFLSVVIPAYNEERRISQTLDQVWGFLSRQVFRWEVLVADDGSTDATPTLVAAFAAQHPGVSLLRLPHGGKGWAVQQGMIAARGDFRFFADADLSMPIEQVFRFLPPERSGYDVAVGSREAPGARRIGEPSRRKLMGRVFHAVVRTLAVRNVMDTQCGFKCFHASAADTLFPALRSKGFAFDVEVLFLAQRMGYRIQEVPIDWYYREGSKVRAVRDSLRMVGDIFRIRWAYLRGRYRTLPTKARRG